MTACSFHRRFALAAAPLLFSAVFLFAASNTWADIYSINNYPTDQWDAYYGGYDTVSGTIVTDGYQGSVFSSTDPMSHIVGGTLTLATLGGTFTGPIVYCAADGGENYTIRAGSILLPGMEGMSIQAALPGGYKLLAYYQNWDTSPSDEPYSCWVQPPNAGPGIGVAGFFSLAAGTPGSISANDPWIIATAVPEPGTFAPPDLGSAGTCSGSLCAA